MLLLVVTVTVFDEERNASVELSNTKRQVKRTKQSFIVPFLFLIVLFVLCPSSCQNEYSVACGDLFLVRI